MDIFSTILGVIKVADSIRKIIDDVRDSPAELKALNTEIVAMRGAMCHCEDVLRSDPKMQQTFAPIAKTAHSTLDDLMTTIRPYHEAVKRGGIFDRWKLLRKYLDKDKIAQHRNSLLSHTALMNLFCSLRTCQSTAGIETAVKDTASLLRYQQVNMRKNEQRMLLELVMARINGQDFAALSDDLVYLLESCRSILEDARHLKIRRRATIHPQVQESGLTAYHDFNIYTFLARLEVHDRDQNYRKIPEADPETCNWIFQNPAYLAWRQSDDSGTFYLSGQMGCGKSVLTKHVMKNIRKMTSHPPVPHDDFAILYYFCSSVSRGTDATETAHRMLQILVHQFLFRRPDLFDAITEHTDVLDGHNLTGPDVKLSLSTLWAILIAALNASIHVEIYCFIDALDECDLSSMTEFMDLYKSSCKNDFNEGKKIKFFISSRLGAADIRISQLLRNTSRVHHLEVKAELVAPDVKVVVKNGLSKMDDLELTSSQRDEIQALLTEKAEGMFIWVRTALTMIENSADIMPFNGILTLINNMPPEMNELYLQAMMRLSKSLKSDKESLNLVRRVLGILLHVYRPLSIEELSLALAIDPAERTLRNVENRRIPVTQFIMKRLSPFVIIVPPKVNNPNDQEVLDDVFLGTRKRDPKSTVRIVHETAQKFLLDVCYGGDPELAGLCINKAKCHEDLAKICLSYLCSEELQLGWINPDGVNESGQRIIDEKTKSIMKTRLQDYTLLGYASLNWARHLRYCTEGDDDAYGLALEFLFEHGSGLECAEQIRQFLNAPDEHRYWGIFHPLVKAAHIDSLVLCRRIISRGDIPINATDESGATALSVACGHTPYDELLLASLEIVTMLLEHNADPSVVDNIGRTAMHWAAIHGHAPLLRILLEHGVSAEIKDIYGDTPIHHVVHNDNLDAARVLLDARIDVSSTDNRGRTPLHCAALYGHTAIAELLILHHASPTAVDKNGYTPLHMACATGGLDCFRLLLRHGAPKDARDDRGQGCLALAASRGHSDLVRALCEAGIQVNEKSNTGWTALHLSAEAGHLDCCNILLDHHADIEALDNWSNTPLWHAARLGRVDVLELLLDRGANSSLNTENLVLHQACREDQLEVAKSLLKRGCRIDERDSDGMTALDVALKEKHTVVTLELLRSNQPFTIRQQTLSFLMELDEPEVAIFSLARVDGRNEKFEMAFDVENSRKETVLHTAARNETLEASQTFIGAAMEIGQPRLRGWTALHMAAAVGSPKITELLLNSGGAQIMCDSNGWTPINIAAEYGRQEVNDIFAKPPWNSIQVNTFSSPAPSRLYPKDGSPGLVFSLDDTVVELPESCPAPKFETEIREQEDGSKLKEFYFSSPGYAVRADFCIPMECEEYFFETEILADGDPCFVVVGLGWLSAELDAAVGWREGTWGYHGDDAVVRDGVNEDKRYGEVFHAGDSIGCGYLKAKGIVYFTKNGKYLGVAFDGVRGQLYPMVSLISPGSKIKCRFDAPIPVKEIPHNGASSLVIRSEEMVDEHAKVEASSIGC